MCAEYVGLGMGIVGSKDAFVYELEALADGGAGAGCAMPFGSE